MKRGKKTFVSNLLLPPASAPFLVYNPSLSIITLELISARLLHTVLINYSPHGYRSFPRRTRGQSSIIILLHHLSHSLLLVTVSSLGSWIPFPGAPCWRLLFSMTSFSPLSTLASLLTLLICISSHSFPASGRSYVTGSGQRAMSRRDRSLPSKAWHVTLQLSLLLQIVKKSSCWHAGWKEPEQTDRWVTRKDRCSGNEPRLTSGFIWLSNKLLCVCIQPLGFGSYLLLRQKPSLSWPIQLLIQS